MQEKCARKNRKSVCYADLVLESKTFSDQKKPKKPHSAGIHYYTQQQLKRNAAHSV
jgi:hypothetical protein